MAIKHTIKTSSGLTATDAIHRIKSTTVYRVVTEDGDTKHMMGYVCASYADEKSHTPFQESTNQCNIDISGKNFIEQAYVDLKTKPIFSGCRDC